jgi:protein-disulfide isomerase
MSGVVKEAIALYGDKVALVFRHFPFTFHPFAWKAAEAAAAANAQGKGAEYMKTLFANQSSLDGTRLTHDASVAGIRAAVDRELARK